MMEATTAILGFTRILVLVLGLSIAYFSYKAYAETGSLYLRNAAIGFGIVSLGVFLEGVLFELLGWDLVLVHIIESLVVSIGFGVILYSLLR